MQNLKSLLQRALLALAFVAGTAMAGPTYHVSIDTSAYTGTGYLDLFFGSAPDASQATATITHFTGALGTGMLGGDATGAAPGPISLSSASGFDQYTTDVILGGIFSFDISFAGDYESVSGTDFATLALSLYNADFTEYLGNPNGALAEFNVTSITDEAPANVAVAVNALEVTVTEGAAVPEASQWAIFFTGLGLMAWTVRRRQQR